MSARKGNAAENAVKHELEAEGWLCKGTGDSHGAVDIVALKLGAIPMLVQVKANKAGGPFSNFRREDRRVLLAEAERAGARAVLAYRKGNGKTVVTRWVWPEEWPEAPAPARAVVVDVVT